MCLAVPMRIVTIDGFVARCEAKGIERSVNLILMQHETLAPGDVVMVHVGYAIQMMTEEEAYQLLGERLHRLFDPLSWKSDVRKRMKAIELGEW